MIRIFINLFHQIILKVIQMARHFGQFYKRMVDDISELGGLTFLVIDPPNQSPEIAGRTAKLAEEVGVNAIAVGGSVGAQGELLDGTILQIKENSSLPVVLFPGNIATISKHADAIYFMSMLNSLDPYYISGAQIVSSMPIKRLNLEPIPTSYIIVEPGRAVGWVGRAKIIPRELPYLAAATALAGEFMGAHACILEAGGGAPSPAPIEMVKMVRDAINIPLIVAGGVRNEKYAYDTIKAGADVIHVGTAIEETSSDLKAAKAKLTKITSAVKKAGKEKLK